jgi:ribosome maturation factor RimP
MREVDLDLIRKEAERIVDKYGLEIFDLTFRRENRGWVLRLTIDNPVGYVSIRDCELVSRELERWLDEEDIISQRYILEVSSPGLDRPLRGEKDYLRFKGKLAKFVMNDGSVVIGRIVSYEDGVVNVDEDGSERSIDLSQVKRANLEPEI